eukprot:TCONS_00011670-protein
MSSNEKIVVIDVTSLQECTAETLKCSEKIKAESTQKCDENSTECKPTFNELSTTKNEDFEECKENRGCQQDRNGSFKFSTTTYCGTCRKVLEADLVDGQCEKCNRNIMHELSKDDTVSQLQISVDNLDGCSEQPSPAKSTTTIISATASERTCRICLDNIDQGDLIAPCKCSGSTKYAHESCMLKWFFKSSKKSCEVCLGNVNVKPIGFKPFQEWRLPDSGCDFIVYLFGLYFLIMIVFTGMITWIATQGCIAPVCVTLYTVCAVAVFYFFYCCGCVEYSRRYWRALLSVNKVWRIYGRADSLKNFKHQVKKGDCKTPTNNILTSNKNEPFVINIETKLTAPIEVCAEASSSSLQEDNNNLNAVPDDSMGIDNVAMEIEDMECACANNQDGSKAIV